MLHLLRLRGVLILSYLLGKLHISLQSGHLGHKGEKFCLPLVRRPPVVVVDLVSVSVLFQFKIQDILNSE